MNPSSKVRAIIYTLGVFVNAFFGVLATGEVKLPIWVVAALAGFNAVLALMAKANVTPEGR